MMVKTCKCVHCRFTTDLLVPAINRRTHVSFQYLQALLCGIRILSWDWVHANRSSPSFSDDAFEIAVRSDTATLHMLSHPLM